jgi:hypothetical protein
MSPVTVDEALSAFADHPLLERMKQAMHPSLRNWDVALMDTAEPDTVALSTIVCVGSGRRMRILPVQGGTRTVSALMSVTAVAESLGASTLCGARHEYVAVSFSMHEEAVA